MQGLPSIETSQEFTLPVTLYRTNFESNFPRIVYAGIGKNKDNRRKILLVKYLSCSYMCWRYFEDSKSCKWHC